MLRLAFNGLLVLAPTRIPPENRSQNVGLATKHALLGKEFGPLQTRQTPGPMLDPPLHHDTTVQPQGPTNVSTNVKTSSQ